MFHQSFFNCSAASKAIDTIPDQATTVTFSPVLTTTIPYLTFTCRIKTHEFGYKKELTNNSHQKLHNTYGGCGPRLNPEEGDKWLKAKGSPKAKRNEKPKGKTVPYEKAWN